MAFYEGEMRRLLFCAKIQKFPCTVNHNSGTMDTITLQRIHNDGEIVKYNSYDHFLYNQMYNFWKGA